MNAFIVIAVCMTAVALLWVVVPLLKGGIAAPGVEIRESNLAILRDQLAELDRDLASGVIAADQHARAREELERRALEEGSQPGGAAQAAGGRATAIALVILIPLCAAGMYLWIGTPEGLHPVAEASEAPVSPQQIDEMVARLAARLEKNPDDPKGWMMLGRSYYVMQRMPEAVAAYARAVEKINDDAALYADYADAMAMNQGRRIEGKALELVEKALQIDPQQPKALAMAGTAAFYRKDFPAAIRYWEKMLPMLPPDSEMAKSVVSGIAEAREQGGAKAPAAAAGAGVRTPGASERAVAPVALGVTGRVTLSPKLAAKASPEDTLFVLARAVNGPRIPLAVLRKRVADLPLEFTLDDSLAMRPELKISGFSEVIVSARISKSGNAMSQSGDLLGTAAAVKVGVSDLAITIDQVVP